MTGTSALPRFFSHGVWWGGELEFFLITLGWICSEDALISHTILSGFTPAVHWFPTEIKVSTSAVHFTEDSAYSEGWFHHTLETTNTTLSGSYRVPCLFLFTRFLPCLLALPFLFFLLCSTPLPILVYFLCWANDCVSSNPYLPRSHFLLLLHINSFIDSTRIK